MLSKKLAISHQSSAVRLFVTLTLLASCLLLTTSPVHAQCTNDNGQTTCNGVSGVSQLEQLIVRIIALASGLAFMALIIMLVYAGIKFITSNGEPKNIQAAQQIVTWAVIGMAALVLAWIILLIIQQFVGGGINLTRICLEFDQCTKP